jgi:hypothetical protein
MTFSVAADPPVTSPLALRTRNRRALSSIKEPNVVLQAPPSPFSPANKPPTKAEITRCERSASSIPSAGNNVDVQLPTNSFSLGDLSHPAQPVEQGEKKQNTAITIAGLVALSAAIYAGMHVHSFTTVQPGRGGFTSLSQWRANAAEEWRLSQDSRRLDLTFEEASATSAATGHDGDMFAVRQQELNKWRGSAAHEWRMAPDSQNLSSLERSPDVKWGSLGGLGAWREFAANAWRTSEVSQELEMTFEESQVFSLEAAPFSVSVPAFGKNRDVSWA